MPGILGVDNEVIRRNVHATVLELAAAIAGKKANVSSIRHCGYGADHRQRYVELMRPQSLHSE